MHQYDIYLPVKYLPSMIMYAGYGVSNSNYRVNKRTEFKGFSI